MLWRPVYDRLSGYARAGAGQCSSVRVKYQGTRPMFRMPTGSLTCARLGLLKPSFVPDQPQQDLRDLTRLRLHLVQDRSQLVNRIRHPSSNKEALNSREGSPMSWESEARAILQALCAGERDPERLALLVHKSVAHKHEQLVEALTGDLRPHHQFLLGELLSLLEGLERSIKHVELETPQRLRPVEERLLRLEGITGVSRHTLHVLCAEVGLDLSRFPDAAHLARLRWGLSRTEGECRQAPQRADPARQPLCQDGIGSGCPQHGSDPDLVFGNSIGATRPGGGPNALRSRWVEVTWSSFII